MEAQKKAIVSSLIILAFSSMISVSWLYENCTPLDNSCIELILFGGIIIVITIVYIENSIKRQKERGEWYEKKQELQKPHKSEQKKVWLVSIGRVLLTSLLLGLSVIIQGGFVMLFSGIFVGIGLNRLIRGLTGTLPPSKHPE